MSTKVLMNHTARCLNELYLNPSAMQRSLKISIVLLLDAIYCTDTSVTVYHNCNFVFCKVSQRWVYYICSPSIAGALTSHTFYIDLFCKYPTATMARFKWFYRLACTHLDVPGAFKINKSIYHSKITIHLHCQSVLICRTGYLAYVWNYCHNHSFTTMFIQCQLYIMRWLYKSINMERHINWTINISHVHTTV